MDSSELKAGTLTTKPLHLQQYHPDINKTSQMVMSCNTRTIKNVLKLSHCKNGFGIDAVWIFFVISHEKITFFYGIGGLLK